MSKGSGARASSVTREEMEQNWRRTFKAKAGEHPVETEARYVASVKAEKLNQAIDDALKPPMKPQHDLDERYRLGRHTG